jgi:hypothetical protein
VGAPKYSAGGKLSIFPQNRLVFRCTFDGRHQYFTFNQGGSEMCHIFVGQDPASYESETRSLRLNGQSTSIRRELFTAALSSLRSHQT